MTAFATLPRGQPFHLICPPPPTLKKDPLHDSLLQEGSEWVFTETDTITSSSPTSLRSSQSSPSEIGGDSGVCSEHDTPPPATRKHLTKRTSLTSDSDNDSNASSSEVPLQDFVHTTLHSSLHPPSSSKNHDRSSRGVGTKSKRSSGGCRIVAAHTKKLPSCLLQEIKEKSHEYNRRLFLKNESEKYSGNCLEKLQTQNTEKCRRSNGEKIRAHKREKYHTQKPISSGQRNGRVTRLYSHFQSLSQDIPKLTLSPSPDNSSASSVPLEEEEQEDYFPSHANVSSRKSLFECRDDTASSGFAGLNNIFAPQQEATIKSMKGTVRGVKNRVRAGIATFTSDHRFLKMYVEREKGKLIIYVTTLGTVRETYERCLRLRKILWTLLVRFEEKDVFMSREVQIQLLDRLQARKVTVPHVFMEGQYLGGVELIEKLNESGELRRLLQPYMHPASTTPCDTCGGFRMLPCSVCRGSKKSVHRNNFTLEFVALKCSSCDESGLVSCQECANG